MRTSFSRKAFLAWDYGFLVLFTVMIIVPFANIIALSLSSSEAITMGKVSLWPVGLNVESYKVVLSNVSFLTAFRNSVFLTVVNTALVISTALLAAYALSHKDFVGRRAILTYYLIPLYFSGGLIPTYLLVTNILHLDNTFLALILPVVTSPFLIVIFTNTIRQLPRDLFDAAEIDGAGDITIIFRVVMPLMLPMVAAFIVYNAVNYWNDWANCLYYIRDPGKYTLSYKLRELINNVSQEYDARNLVKTVVNVGLVHPDNVRGAALLISILPIVVVYPFVQKYFIHGVIVGAVKG